MNNGKSKKLFVLALWLEEAESRFGPLSLAELEFLTDNICHFANVIEGNFPKINYEEAYSVARELNLYQPLDKVTLAILKGANTQNPKT